jgi:hypothetical protein
VADSAKLESWNHVLAVRDELFARATEAGLL